MTFVVVYDACVLYPSTLRDLLIRIAQARLVQAKWTDQILDEVFRTADLKDFPQAQLTQWNIEVQGPDEFIVDQIDLNRQAVYGAVQRIADSWRNPPGTVNDVLNSLERSGIVATAAVLRTF